MADHIMVLDGGRLIEWGTHKELVSNGGHYATLYEFQLKQMGLEVQATSSQRRSSEKQVVS
jgi:ABC-type transport system involved in cytochrome bd biosynthesis fused ATPase/permease subunit